jgi:hypothetical protein
MDKLIIYAVMGRGYLVVNSSKNIGLFSGTLEKCENFIRCHI